MRMAHSTVWSPAGTMCAWPGAQSPAVLRPKLLSGRVQSVQVAARSSISREGVNNSRAPRSSGKIFAAMPGDHGASILHGGATLQQFGHFRQVGGAVRACSEFLHHAFTLFVQFLLRESAFAHFRLHKRIGCMRAAVYFLICLPESLGGASGHRCRCRSRTIHDRASGIPHGSGAHQVPDGNIPPQSARDIPSRKTRRSATPFPSSATHRAIVGMKAVRPTCPQGLLFGETGQLVPAPVAVIDLAFEVAVQTICGIASASMRSRASPSRAALGMRFRMLGCDREMRSRSPRLEAEN